MPESKREFANGVIGVEPQDDTLVVEAPSAELALAEVTTALGPSARIVGAEKVLRGGIGGFFAREMVQLRAQAADASDERAAGGQAAGSPSLPLDRLLQTLHDDAEAEERSFADVLREQLGSADVASAQVQPGPAAPRDSDGAREEGAQGPAPSTLPPLPAGGDGNGRLIGVPAPGPAGSRPARDVHAGPQWSVANLQRLGLPPLVVDAVRDLDRADDQDWFAAIAAALKPLCRALPNGAQALAGPRADRLAAALGVPLAIPAGDFGATGDMAVVLRDSEQHRSWLGWARGNRWLHLAVGGDGWRGLLFDEPAVLSWVGDDALPEALTLCATLDLPLAYGVDNRGVAARARPVDVAAAIRALLPWQ